jgi:hypothetical protein
VADGLEVPSTQLFRFTLLVPTIAPKRDEKGLQSWYPEATPQESSCVRRGYSCSAVKVGGIKWLAYLEIWTARNFDGG